MSPFGIRIAAPFDAISLEELERRASLRTRVDTKYIVSYETLAKLFEELRNSHRVLEIEGRRVFSYETTYFDSASLSSYRAHVQRRRRRFKCRSRRYPSDGRAFFEVKLKGRRGETLKRRIPYSNEEHGRMTDTARDFLRDTIAEIYGTPSLESLEPVLSSKYDRVTLVAPHLGQRLTCDFGLTFTDAASGRAGIREHAVIVESKSNHGNDAVDRMLRGLGARPLSGCSKYCLGVSLLRESVRSNDFRRLRSRHFVSAATAAQGLVARPLLADGSSVE